MSTIAAVHAREILDSRGRPTVEAEVALNDGTCAVGSVPSGASMGRHEAVELRDRDPRRYNGRGVRRAVANVHREIAGVLVGSEADLAAVDRTLIALDGTANKSRLGANALLAVSLATARAAAASAGVPLWRYLAGDGPVTLPLPMVNIVSGGLHAGRQLDFQDFLVIPVAAASYADALEICVRVHGACAAALEARGLSTLRADEGGFGPPLGSAEGALELLEHAVTGAGLEPGVDVVYGLDVAATHFYDPESGLYRMEAAGAERDAEELTTLLADLCDRFPIASIEDPLAEDDWGGWAILTERLGERVQLIGDDLFTTNLGRLRRGVELGAANAVLVKMNQIGTVSETLALVRHARAAGYSTIVSARSGETEDAFLADLAVGTAAGQIKVGSVTQSERLAKYNQLLRIEEEMAADAVFAGRSAIALRRAERAR